MRSVRRAYDWFDRWVRNRSRAGFAVIVGLWSALGMLALGVVLDGLTVPNAVTMGLAMAVAYYAFDPQDKG